MRIQDFMASILAPRVASVQVDNILFEVDRNMHIQIRVLDGGVIQPMAVSVIPATIRKLEQQIDACRRFRTLCENGEAVIKVEKNVNGTSRCTVSLYDRSESCVYTRLGQPPVFGKSRLRRKPAPLQEATIKVSDAMYLANMTDEDVNAMCIQYPSFKGSVDLIQDSL